LKNGCEHNMALSSEYGIKKGYPKLRKHFGKLVGYLQLCRAFTLVAPILAGVFGVLTPVKNITFSSITTAVFVGVTLALAQACGQSLNQYADADLDKLAKPYRPIPSGLITREEALGLGWLLALFALGRAFTISDFFGLIVIALLFFAVFYSLSPFSPRKVNPLLNTSWMAISRGLLPVLAVWSVFGALSVSAWNYSILAFLWVFGFQATKDVGDAEVDRQFHIKTIPNTWGTMGLLATMGISSLMFSIYAIISGAYIMLTLLIFAVIAMLTVKKQAILTENTISWMCFYLGLGFFYIIMFLTFHL